MKKVSFIFIETSCICQRDYFIGNSTENPIQLTGGNRIIPSTCVKCTPGLVSSNDRSRCMTCTNGQVDLEKKDCKCLENQIIVENFVNNTKSCFTCPENQIPGPINSVYKTECLKCNEGEMFQIVGSFASCVCLNNYQRAGDRCVPIDEMQNILSKYSSLVARNLLFDYIDYSEETLISEKLNKRNSAINSITGETSVVKIEKINVNSDLIEYYFYDNVYNCLKAINVTESCQILANLCVIAMYDEANPTCLVYNLINSSKNRLPANINNE